MREIARALREGTTRPTMALLVVASLFQTIQLLMVDPLTSRPHRVALSFVADHETWGYAHALAVLLLVWRLWDKTARPLCAWVTNGYTCALWVMTFLAPAVLLRDTTLMATPLVVIPISAMWVLMRTEATRRDREHA
ncbi:hypothetical protein CO641_02345 [Lysobacteraceae bacterium NML91-0213]|nr:hypothetical protein CO641_02345 [Xanthomonadaceae bacterium NML91-0213]